MKKRALNHYYIDKIRDMELEEGSFLDDPRLSFTETGFLALALDLQRKEKVTLRLISSRTTSTEKENLQVLRKLKNFGYVEEKESRSYGPWGEVTIWHFHYFPNMKALFVA
ncbi:hypothetical protein [Leptospira sanjuanensis]|uniref:hypothetical protein n=1 Tax=Leptospira sanjuanensis TaxID=2879643 RepID=UPI001EE8DE03|nr:hypothetical protein [Leptospira sanjuanensis]MCG6170262.1 hypothetical protein [Leptospira sanjuanensis]